VPGAEERPLLALLTAAAPDVVSTDRLVEVLCNGDAPATARRSLHAHVVHLRSALEPERPARLQRALRRPAWDRLRLAAGREEIDAAHVADLTTRGRARLATGDAAGSAWLEHACTVARRDLGRGEWWEVLLGPHVPDDLRRARLTPPVSTGSANDVVEEAASRIPWVRSAPTVRRSPG
jgi:hypothetical protein